MERKVVRAIGDALRGPRLPGPRAPRDPVLVVLRVVKDMVDVSVDASGEALHRRGWRKAIARAPIRENLAAAVLRLAEWSPGEALVDPMCGSGTFPIEAASVSAGLAPGRARTFAFERWPEHDPAAWRASRASARANPVGIGVILGSDRDAAAMIATRANAARAGIEGRILLDTASFAELEPPDCSPGLVVINPPYGKRLQAGRASAVYRDLGRVLRERWSRWRLAVLVPERRLLGPLGIKGVEPTVTFSNGGVRVSLCVGQVG